MRRENEKSDMQLRIPVTPSEHRQVMDAVSKMGLKFAEFARRIIFENIDSTMNARTATLPGRRNPDFREDWQAIHDEAAARRDAASISERDFMYRLSNLSSAERAEMQLVHEQWEEAHRVCLRSLDVYQHRTFEDALAWLNRNFCSTDPVVVDDIASFEDVRQLMNAAYRIYSRRRKLEELSRNVLNLAKPEDFAPFADISKCKSFDIVKSDRNSKMHVLFVTDVFDDTLHVCVQSDGRGAGVMSRCEELIEVFLRRETPEWTSRRWFGRAKLPKMQFYIYFAPSEFHKEMFNRVELAAPLSPGKPIAAVRWHDVGSVPAAIRPKWLPGGLADWQTHLLDDID